MNVLYCIQTLRGRFSRQHSYVGPATGTVMRTAIVTKGYDEVPGCLVLPTYGEEHHASN